MRMKPSLMELVPLWKDTEERWSSRFVSLSISGAGRSPGEGNGYPLQYSCLENSMDRRSWRATVYEVTKSWNDETTNTHFFFSAMWRHSKKPGRGVSLDTEPASTLIWDFLASRTRDVNVCCQSHLVYNNLPFPSPGDLPDPGIEPRSPAL